MSAESIRLCALDELPDGHSRGFGVSTDRGVVDLFVVRSGGRVFGYLNSCPHTGGPLDWVPDRFLDLDGRLIQCSTHDARFRIEDGLCVAGPCGGASLTPVRLEVREQEIWLIP